MDLTSLLLRFVKHLKRNFLETIKLGCWRYLMPLILGEIFPAVINLMRKNVSLSWLVSYSLPAPTNPATPPAFSIYLLEAALLDIAEEDPCRAPCTSPILNLPVGETYTVFPDKLQQCRLIPTQSPLPISLPSDQLANQSLLLFRFLR